MRRSRVPELLKDRESHRESVVTFRLLGRSCGVVILLGSGPKGKRALETGSLGFQEIAWRLGAPKQGRIRT